MELIITSRNATVTENMRELIEKKVSRLRDHEEGMLSCRVTLDVHGGRAQVGIIARMPGHELFARGAGENIGKALDLAVPRTLRQVERAAGNRKEHAALPLDATGAYAMAA